jgi:NNMT/PNMT/TEMT family
VGKLPECGAASSNSSFEWDRFDSETYFAHNYGVMRAEDRRLLEMTAAAFAKQPDKLNILDVGTGSNIYPILAALPRAKQITAWEFSAQNVAWLKKEKQRHTLRPEWQSFWSAVRKVYGKSHQILPDEPMRWLNERLRVKQHSVFDLPRGKWEASTMFFCAESLTNDKAEFERATHKWAKAVQPGGLLVGAFMEQSKGYLVGGLHFPAFPVTKVILTKTLDPVANIESVKRIPVGGHPIRPGYSGMLYVVATAK